MASLLFGKDGVYKSVECSVGRARPDQVWIIAHLLTYLSSSFARLAPKKSGEKTDKFQKNAVFGSFFFTKISSYEISLTLK